MSTYIVEFIGVFIFGIEIGVLLCLIVQTLSCRRREQDQARRQFQLEIQSLRRDLDALRPEIDRMLQRHPSTS